MHNPDGLPHTQPQALPQTAGKAPYERPTLVEYGDVRALTNNVGGHGPLDGGHRGLTPLRSQL
jgi:hypothetical protein